MEESNDRILQMVKRFTQFCILPFFKLLFLGILLLKEIKKLPYSFLQPYNFPLHECIAL